MEALLWLLRVITPRNIVLGTALVVAGILAKQFYHIPMLKYKNWRYPPTKAPADVTITSELEKRAVLKLRARYRRIQALLEESRAAGYNVDGQAAKAKAAMAFDRPGLRHFAHQELVKLEMLIPRKRQQYIPMDQEAVDDAAWPGEQPKPLPGKTATAPKGSARKGRK